MVRKELILATILAIFSFCCQAQAAQIAVSWDGGGDGQTWTDQNNWNPNIVPDNDGGNTFAVTIDAGAGELRIGLRQGGITTIDRLDCYGEVEIHTETPEWVNLNLVGPNGLTNHGDLSIDTEVNINGNVTNTAGAHLNLMDLDIEGNLNNPAGGTIDIEYEFRVAGNVDNAGAMILSPASDLFVEEMGNTFHNTGQLEIYNAFCGAEDLFHNDSTGTITGVGGFIHSDTSIQNDGQIWAQAGSLALHCMGSLTNTGTLGNKPLASLAIQPDNDVNNFGTIEVNAGGGVAFDSNLVNEPNGVIELLGGTLAATTIMQTADANFQGQGNIPTENLVVETDGLIRLTGPTNIFGNVQIDPNATLEISDGQTLVKGHTTCNNGTIYMIGGRVICQGGLTNNNCNIIWEPGTYTNLADFNLDGTVDFKDYADFADTWLWQASWY